VTRQLDGRTALVTGGGIGIGADIAATLAEAGARVALTYLTHEPHPALVGRITAASGAPPLCLRLDATDEAAVTATVDEAAAGLGGLDILVNNVGGLVRRSPIAQMSFELWRTVQAVNVDSAFLVSRAALRHLRDGGRVVNISSISGFAGGSAGSTAYATAKAAVVGFTRGLAKELAPRAITVNAIAPGFIEATPFHDTFTTPEGKATATAGIPLGHVGVPADVSGPALWLCSDAAAFVTGEVVQVNGGAYLG